MTAAVRATLFAAWLSIGVTACAYHPARIAVKPGDPPSEAACVAAGGTWGRHGLMVRCSFRTTDAGASCRDSIECEGQCIAPAGTRNGARASGTCSVVDHVYSRQVLVEKGRAVEMIIE